ncbi:hypothetical protein Fuma_00416 [Fuerstiella marisgermanici]|uniref:Uncharacterized protein n=1 Tax=Fuerstiella marisgermanici TaxID=1891926 RepID=A0A1P8W9V4_9PLAN|nr:hypothetical protein Fuma_00416 [Fuerstiella marisgermanici]
MESGSTENLTRCGSENAILPTIGDKRHCPGHVETSLGASTPCCAVDFARNPELRSNRRNSGESLYDAGRILTGE